MSRDVRTPGPDHPITVEPARRHLTVTAGGTVVAETDAALALTESTYPVVYYIPLTDVDATRLRPTESHTWCPYKGEASYFALTTEQGEIADALWHYPTPHAGVAGIAGHVAFYPQHVDITTGEPQ